MTCVDEHDFGMGYLETMRVVRNFGSHWGIVPSDDEGNEGDEQPDTQLEQQPKPRPRLRNVIGRGERGKPMHPPAPMVGSHIRDDMDWGYYGEHGSAFPYGAAASSWVSLPNFPEVDRVSRTWRRWGGH
ncbi:unnamed protein product [Lactuca saligna]|uniref:Uncharacterized protein n=1 Tax=Lactuca saligna TaxID=75948 RepID=A0AA35VIU7_LACSI|nr:unnamed protein product [Lactuca saligna]